MEAESQDELILVFLLECIDLLHTQFEDTALSMLPSNTWVVFLVSLCSLYLQPVCL